MFKIYFKQAIQMLRQNRFVSTISIAGTALAVMMIMTIVVVHEMSVLSVDPEPNRDRTLYIAMYKRQTKPGKGQSTNLRSLDEERVKILSELKTPEMISFYGEELFEWMPMPVRAEGGQEEFLKGMRPTDAAYWRVFNLRFLQGRPYTEQEFRSGDRVAVLSASLARELYKGASPIGKGFVADSKTYRVVGVAEDVPRVFSDTFGDFYVPATTTQFTACRAAMVMRSREDYAAVNAEIRALEERQNIEDDTWDMAFIGPFTRWQMQSGAAWSSDGGAQIVKVYNRQRIFIVLVLLLIPALNLSGFSLSRVRKRMAEIGIRKAFGARRRTIVTQVLSENFITSFIGGLIGLGLSWCVLIGFRHWLLGVPAADVLPVSVMVSPMTWLAVFAACFALNLLSAGVPAWRAARTNIINSINQNDKTL